VLNIVNMKIFFVILSLADLPAELARQAGDLV
jgi:hypothetical protein